MQNEYGNEILSTDAIWHEWMMEVIRIKPSLGAKAIHIWSKLDNQLVLPTKINNYAIEDQIVFDEELLLQELKRELGSHLFDRWLKLSNVKGVTCRTRCGNIDIDD